MQQETLLQLTDKGLYCPVGNFYVDPWQPVERAIVTHAHGDHATWGCRRYLVADEGKHVFRTRLGPDATIQTLPYGETKDVDGVRVSLHPAGHILGSAQIRIEYQGEVWVVSGDYKLEPDVTCAPFELVRCHIFITESTFGLPIFRWQSETDIFDSINTWWRANQEAGKASLLFGYTLGKAQRLIAGVDASIGPIYTHGAVERINKDYRASGVPLPDTIYAGGVGKTDWSRGLIIAPPSARATPWTRRFGTLSTGFASGWMRIRGARRQRSVDRGFVLSDHVDWPRLLETISATGAERVWVTHGYTAVVVRWLVEHGIDARIAPTRFSDERNDAGDFVDEADTLESETPENS
jgi:putative mRNA 3-end processing factor